MSQVKEQQIELYQDNKRIHPKYVMGRFARLRILAIFVTQFVFFILPWINYTGRQAVLFDISNYHFYIFGLLLLPGDLIFLSGLLFLSAFGLFWWTTIAGRLWCGYACPQTVYTEIMLWFDYWFEGDRNKRLKLDKSKWDAKKIRTKALKYLVITIFCIWTGLTFVGWFVPIREVFVNFIHFNLSGSEWFSAGFYGFMTFFFAHIMREQVCKYMCPYARFQSAMYDKDTLVISYDPGRGEPRGARKKNADNSQLGDCVNCTLCVQVCPVGIDIRDGLQYECIGCAACIDACDDVMKKVDKPRGLIRYTTEAALEKEYPESKIITRLKRPRVLGYGIILFVVLIAVLTGLFTRNTIRVDIIKDRGVLVRENARGWTENAYTLRISNASDKVQVVNAHATGFDKIALTGFPKNMTIPAGATVSIPVQVSTPGDNNIEDNAVGAPTTNIYFHFTYNAKGKTKVRSFEEKAVFLGEQ